MNAVIQSTLYVVLKYVFVVSEIPENTNDVKHCFSTASSQTGSGPVGPFVLFCRSVDILSNTRSVQKVRRLFELRSSHLFQMHLLGVARFTEIS